MTFSEPDQQSTRHAGQLDHESNDGSSIHCEHSEYSSSEGTTSHESDNDNIGQDDFGSLSGRDPDDACSIKIDGTSVDHEKSHKVLARITQRCHPRCEPSLDNSSEWDQEVVNTIRNRSARRQEHCQNEHREERASWSESTEKATKCSHKYCDQGLPRRRVRSPTTEARTYQSDLVPLSVFEMYYHGWKQNCSRKSTVALLLSVMVWLYVQMQFVAIQQPEQKTKQTVDLAHLAALRKQREIEALNRLGSAANQNYKENKRPRSEKQGSVTEKLPDGCLTTGWQSFSFPNCNEIHEIDLPVSLHIRRRNREILVEGKDELLGFAGDGLWRQVWKVDPRGELGPQSNSSDVPAVLKLMMMEHEYDQRNFDRHRRDGLVMERFTSSNNIVSLYGFCGNTVLTEYIDQSLDDVLKASSGGDETFGQFSRSTPAGRIRLALDVARGLEKLHTIEGGPIVHADIQTKQFLFDPSHGVKLNDFNRCRFLPKNNVTGLPCRIRIPSAPGASRSPEEYNKQELDEKLDVFSVAHVLYHILTGVVPWSDDSKQDKVTHVMNGEIPTIDKEIRENSISDAALATLVEKAYQHDPKERISARSLVNELESIFHKMKKDLEQN